MPLKAWLRAVALAFLGIAPLAVAVMAAIRGQGASRTVAIGAAVGIVGCAAYLLWVYLPDLDWKAARRGPRGRRRVALTFDDGPNGADTEAVLEVLRRHGARATFFCVGQAARRHPGLIRRMVEAGHVVGNHTLEHRKLAWCSPAQVRRQIREAQEALEAAGAPRPRWFRAPHGFKSPFLGAALRAEGLEMVAWSHGVWDTDRPGVEVIAARACSHLVDGEILLLHDGTDGADRSQTALALESILAECRRRGLEPVTLPELLSS